MERTLSRVGTFAAHITPGVYPAGGYGYSDIHLADGALAVAYQHADLRWP